MLEHGEAKVLITDREFSPTIAKALRCCEAQPLVIDVDDPEYAGRRAARRDRLRSASSPTATRSSRGSWPADEWDAISLNYTSGTTGNPKGVVYHHRGAYLNAVCNIVDLEHAARTRSTCGRCRCSTATAGASRGPWRRNAGTNVCLRKVEAERDLRR